jgi:hypothetical protein
VDERWMRGRPVRLAGVVGLGVHLRPSLQVLPDVSGRKLSALPRKLDQLRESSSGQKQVVMGATWPVTTLLKYVTLSGGS